MKRQFLFLALALTTALAPGRVLAQESAPERKAQPKTAAEKPPVPIDAQIAEDFAEKPLVPLDIQIVVSRYQGEKKVSSLPFSVAVNANEPLASQLRMGANVPVAATVFTPKEGATPPVQSWNYRDVGTAIDCTAKTLDDGRFQLWVSVEDSSVYAGVQDGTTPSVRDVPVIRSFKSKNTLLLRDGQTRQFTAATDRVNGEVVKIDVTLRVVK